MPGEVVVVGLGPAGADLVTAGARAAIERVPVERRFVRTRRHPAVEELAMLDGVASFDGLYESGESLAAVYAGIVDALVVASRTGPVVYAVPGSPAVAERTVELLRERAAAGAVRLDVVPALSCLDLAWARLGVDPLCGVRVVDGHRFAVDAAGERGPLLVLQCDTKAVLSEIKLAVDDGPSVTVVQRLGRPDESITEVAWADLDRSFEPDHLTSLWIPSLAAPVAAELAGFAELVRTLRERCPWDREQTHESLARYLVEETYETIEAIESGDRAHLEEELGDLLFQVFFHATLGAESGDFTLADVARGIADKLTRRHPHVFGDVTVRDADDVVANWDAIKRDEKGRDSLMDGIPPALPALSAAAKVQKRAASVGFDWDGPDDVYPKVVEELEEVRAAASAAAAQDEIGDLLFSAVNLARHLGVDPEQALRAATRKFRARFAAVEALAADRDIDLATAGLPALDALWDEVKSAHL